jgi:hypothetical protein
MADGLPLSRAFAVRRTSELIGIAGVHLVDHRSEPLDVKAASWRAGGVASAKEANLPDSTIMEMGRWTSSAWLHYTARDLAEIQQAMAAMWSAARVPDGAPAGAQVVKVVLKVVGVAVQVVVKVVLKVVGVAVAGPRVGWV